MDFLIFSLASFIANYSAVRAVCVSLDKCYKSSFNSFSKDPSEPLRAEFARALALSTNACYSAVRLVFRLPRVEFKLLKDEFTRLLKVEFKLLKDAFAAALALSIIACYSAVSYAFD